MLCSATQSQMTQEGLEKGHRPHPILTCAHVHLHTCMHMPACTSFFPMFCMLVASATREECVECQCTCWMLHCSQCLWKWREGWWLKASSNSFHWCSINLECQLINLGGPTHIMATFWMLCGSLRQHHVEMNSVSGNVTSCEVIVVNVVRDMLND